MLPGRIGAHDDEIVRRAEVAVRGPGWEQDDIASVKGQLLAGRATEDHRHVPAPDAQYLMGGAVVVVEGEDAVLPGALPAMVDKAPFDDVCAIPAALNRDPLTPEQHRQTAVLEGAVVGQDERFGTKTSHDALSPMS
jgi:hypothetical protein